MKRMKEIREMSLEEIKKDVESIRSNYPQLSDSCDAIDFDRPKGAINKDYKYLLDEVEECDDPDLQDYYKFKNCQGRLKALHNEISHYWECSLSGFGEAMAMDKEASEREYKALQKAYDNLHDELYPIMKETYKGYKAHSEFCRLNYTYYEEFEKDEDDIFSLLGLD